MILQDLYAMVENNFARMVLLQTCKECSILLDRRVERSHDLDDSTARRYKFPKNYTTNFTPMWTELYNSSMKQSKKSTAAGRHEKKDILREEDKMFHLQSKGTWFNQM
ncbi:unnamed protein product [Hermetia illucens]|uniref:Uncharacterized protein n=1 Tax=Hermetia illucens TaxID=343691 RepID=A0A7R8UQV3_HERIL|nr:unnamed protein product [Hermetia illucens]